MSGENRIASRTAARTSRFAIPRATILIAALTSPGFLALDSTSVLPSVPDSGTPPSGPVGAWAACSQPAIHATQANAPKCKRLIPTSCCTLRGPCASPARLVRIGACVRHLPPAGASFTFGWRLIDQSADHAGPVRSDYQCRMHAEGHYRTSASACCYDHWCGTGRMVGKLCLRVFGDTLNESSKTRARGRSLTNRGYWRTEQR